MEKGSHRLRLKINLSLREFVKNAKEKLKKMSESFLVKLVKSFVGGRFDV